jgi:hypothetical protein
VQKWCFSNPGLLLQESLEGLLQPPLLVLLVLLQHVPASPLRSNRTSCLLAADMEAQKAALVEALAAKCGALLKLQEAATASTAAPPPAADAPATVEGGDDAATEPAALAPALPSVPADTSTGTGTDAAAAPGAVSAFEAAFRELRCWVDTAADEKVSWLRCGATKKQAV